MHVKTARKSTASILLMLFIATTMPFLDMGCKKKFPCSRPTDETDFDITLDKFLDNCYTTVNGTEHIRYKGTLKIEYLDGCLRSPVEFHTYTIESPNTPQKQPITIHTRVPASTEFIVTVDIQGEQCARCASGYAGAADPSWRCIETQVAGGYAVAIPKWKGGYRLKATSGGVTLNNLIHAMNVDRSCGCIVYY